MSLTKSFRNSFIRVTGTNNTVKGEIIYNAGDIKRTLDVWAKKIKLKYWFIQHDADINDSKTHFHILVSFKSPVPFKNLKSKFPFGHIESARNKKNCAIYLLHGNDKLKVQYHKEQIITNDPIQLDNLLVNYDPSALTKDDYLLQISDGDIREWSQFELIPSDIWIKNKMIFENAFTYYKQKYYMSKNRKVNVIYVFGETSTGKTTFVKDYCQRLSLSLCVSSSSNDPLQDYKGEDVLLLDDLKKDAFSYQDMLKILDNHTKSTAKSRYVNKIFMGATIFITSISSLYDWYFDETSESKKQLYRRIKELYKFDKNKITRFVYSEIFHRYEEIETTDNYIKAKFENVEPIKSLFSQMNLETEKAKESFVGGGQSRREDDDADNEKSLFDN